MQRALFVAALLFSLLLVSCSKSTVTGPSPVQSKSSVKLTLSMKDAPSDIATIVGILSRQGYDTLESNFTVSNDTAQCQFSDVPAGEWHLVVNAYDTSGQVKFSGSTDVQVFGGETTPVNLVLNPSTGSISVTVTWGNRALASNKSLEFDGYSGYVDVPDSPSLTDIDTAYTLEAWIKPAGGAFYNYIIAKGVSSLQYTMELLGDQLNPAFSLAGVTIDFSGATEYWSRLVLNNTIPVGVWSQLAVTYRDGYGIDVYINGQLVHHANASGMLTHVSGDLRLGVLLNSTYQLYFNGFMDDVRIWNTALTADQIQNGMKTQLTGNEPDLVAYWDFNDSLGSTTVADKSPNHNDGKLIGGVNFSADTPF